METEISKDGKRFNGQLVMSFKTIQDARTFIARFSRERQQYLQCYDQQVKSSKKYQTQVKNVRLHISHFIQVLNMCVIRNELKKEQKKLY